MANNRVKISSIVENQLPNFVREEFPLVNEFLSQYYLSIEGQGSTLDIIQNIDQYVKVDNLTNLIDSTTLTQDVNFVDDTILVSSTSGFPSKYGLILIDSEIITYTGITTNSFTGCVRGFSGVTSYKSSNKPDELVFSESQIETHSTGAKVKNLSILFLKEFFKKIKRQIVPGFEDRQLYSEVNEKLFTKQAKDFYSSKGTDQSFEILFRALYGEDVQVIKPRDYLFIPSDAQYRVTKDLVVEKLEGNVEDLLNRTIFQDQTDFLQKASGSVTNVQRIQRNGNEYYVLSLDYDFDKDINVYGSVFGTFSVHPQTKLITSVSIGSTVLDVDSTVGFPTSGTLVADYSDGTSTKIDYQSKTLNQFFGCSGIDRNIVSTQDLRLDAYAYGYSGLSTSNVVKVRICGVLSELDILNKPGQIYYEEGDSIEIKSLGTELSDNISNNWFFNIPVTFNVKEIEIKNNLNFSYELKTFDKHRFVLGDKCKLISTDGIEKNCTIISIVDEYSFIINDQGEIDTQKKYSIKKILSKVNSSNYPELNIYNTNVQNVYTDNKSLFVSSPSIPSYLNQSLNINNRSVTFSGIFDGENIFIPNHGFYTGDSVYYKSSDPSNTLNINEGIYFIKRVDKDNIKLSQSRSNIYFDKYVTLSGSIVNGLLEYNSFANKNLEPQKLIRKISNPVTDSKKYETSPGLTGILLNGVEILNYKSSDIISYGSIEKVEVISKGKEYDVINPPILSISDPVGTGASFYCEVEGKLSRIDVIDGGFDYVEDPVITISGGNGIGAIAKANLVSINHQVQFNALGSAGLVNLSNNTVAFSTYHKFRDGEHIIYKTNSRTSVGGLSTNSTYYLSVQDAYTVKFYKSYSDAVRNNNPIDLTSYGSGNHTIETLNKKKVISSVTVINSGLGYKNRKITTNSSGINTASNTINIKNHKYQSGEIITYTPEGSPISGLSTESYYVTKIDENNFKLSKIGTGLTVSDYFYKNNQYVSFKSSGSGNHTFNYPEIQVSVSGKIGVSTLSGQDFNATLKPIFRGEIESIFVNDGGIGYGSSEILNYNRQPTFSLNSGSGAILKAVISQGKISDVLIFNSGNGYNSQPDIQIVTSTGSGAILVPIISNGSIIDVKVVNGGIGYNDKDIQLNVISSGSDAKFLSIPKKWTINIFERLLRNNQIVDDDGVITQGTNSNYGLQYSHLYSPRKLRQSVFASKIVDGNLQYTPDLKLQNGVEVLSNSHSPIIGWAYDGNPIYGPYGYSSLSGGSIKLMKSGYSLKSNISSNQNRPDTSMYPEGIFVEDYEYQRNGDLDEYNGRFCVTPEFPKGTYVYFTTINPDGLEDDTSSKFNRYRKPEFPYFIGNYFRSKPIEFNFDRYSNQDDIDINSIGLIRNTTPYNLSKNNSRYDFISNENKNYKNDTIITSVSYGQVDSVGIITGGSNYKVNDIIVFDDSDTSGYGAQAKVSSILGKKIEDIIISSSTIQNVEFIPYKSNSTFIGFTTIPHFLTDNDVISISGFSTVIGTNLKSFFTVGVSSNTYLLSENVESSSTTGIITYFSVYGDLSYPYITENDIFQIENEKIKVLNIDTKSSRIKVQREYEGTVGISHTASTLLFEIPRKLTVNFSPINSQQYKFDLTKDFYFNPKETLGIGTINGVGIGTTLSFSNPGAGITEIFIPTKSLYIPNHNLKTGDELKYYSNGGTAVSISTNGVSSFLLNEGESVYVAKISDDLIGISTYRVGLGSTGLYVGINSSILVDTVYLTGIGTGENHNFRYLPPNVLKGNINKNYATVSTASTHGLNVYNSINLNIISGLTTTVHIRYNDLNRRLVTDPRSFSSLDVNILENSILIQNHNLTTGQKVIHTSSSPSGGLLNDQIYYVFVIDDNTIKLSEFILDSTSTNLKFVNITSASSGTISKINPPILIEKNQTVLFDLSHSSLSFTKNSETYSAFDFNLYFDEKCEIPFYSSSTSNEFEVIKNGSIGISTDSYLKFKVTNSLPQNLYYKLDPINLDLNTVTKKEIINDNENVKNNNTLVIINNSLNGKHVLSGVGSTAFTFNIFDKPTESLYTPINTQIEYFTESETAYGSIYGVQLTSSGRGYKKLPAISSIISSDGKGAILLPRSLTIGKISNINLRDIGVDYSADKSLRPEAHAPKILKISPFSTFKNIGISSLGVNYLVPPNLIVLDGLTNERIFDIDLRCNFKTRNVDIFNNTQALNEVTPIIIPINNSNGISIGSSVQSINFNVSTKDVTISFGASFSSYEDFPFSVGDKVLIENVSVGVGTTFKGYNSSNYNYALFTLTQVDPNIGGTNGSITYNLSNYLKDGEYPGVYRPLDSSGKVIPEKYFPIFNISLEKNKFLKNEFVRSGSSIGRVNSWDYKNGYLKISSFDEFNVGDKILAETSGAEGLISGILYFNSYYNVDSSSIVKKGWNKNTGFLNDSMQRLHDNDYYQYFSYSIRSKVHYEDWSDPVNSLNHTVGFKKFSDLSVESLVSNSGITTNQNYGDFIGISDLISEIELDCVNDFDLSSERSLNIDYNIISDEIILESKTIQDYIESVGNRVLIIDDISSQFNSNERPTKFSIVDSFDLESDRSKKYFIHVKDKLFNNESQIVISSLLHDNSTGFINQYGRVETFDDLGFFDFVVTGTEGKLLFYPTNYEINDYDLNFVSYDIKNNVSGIGTLDLGDTARLYTQTQTIPAGTSSAYTVVGIASTYRSSKVLIQYANVDNSYFEFDEITLIHNDSEVQLLEYGQLTTNSFTASSTTGLGTYFAYFSGSNINLDFIPNNTLSVDCNVNSLIVSIAKTSSIGVGTTSLNTCIFDSRITNISSSASPTSNVISEYSSEYSSGYYIVSVEDTTNNRYQISEILSINDGSDTYITEFGILNDGTNLGEFDATLYSGNTRLLFTPIPNINVQVRVFQNALRPIDDTDLDIIDLSNASLSSGYGLYRGTQSDLKRDFELSHKQIPIFKRSFVGSASSVVDIQKNYIKLPNNFFVTGEELIYDYPQSKIGTDKAIGIATTSISGIGLTDKLPQKIYAIKVDDYKIRFASTVENALKNIPVPLQINSLGVGTDHTLTSKKQNSRVVISIDNLIQSPIVSTSVTTTISEKIGLSDRTIKVSGISSFFGGDLIKVNDEIMRVDSVGFGSTNVFLVKRSWMGTGISTHANSSLVTKVKGNYNIVDNTINFITAPYGNTPIGTTTGSPDDVDYIGITTSSSFSGRSFIRSSIPNTSIEPYSNNYVFDDISLEFTGYSTSFILKSNNANITGFSTDNAIILVNQVFQGPKRVGSSVNILGDCVLKENVGLTSIQFTGSISSTSYDINTTNVPLGGIIVSVASTTGFGYQPLVSAGGTAIVSGLGTISSISIGNSGSGYRSGIQTYVNVGVAVSSVGLYDIEYVGIASISNGHIVSVAITNPGSGYTSTNPPIVIFDDPLPYSNIPLIYSSSSSSGFGSGANVNVIVGLGSSIINFEITNLGYGYDVGEILTIGIGGTVGIPTNTSLSYNEFQLSIDETYSDSFSGWTFGNLLVIDPIDSLFDGKTTLFPITLDNQQKTIRAKSGSNINVEATLLVFINDILQVPGKGYIFNGGSYIRFTEAPKVGDTSKILFYQGTSSVDVVDVDVLETIKIGDIVKLNDDNIAYLEDERIVTRINSTDSLNTNTYFGPGINENETYLRPLTWCKQRNDKFIDGKAVTKDRILYEPLIYPTTNIIQSVGIGSTVIFVESVKTFFDSNKENSLLQNKIKIISQDTPISAAATAVVSVAGTISSIIISNSGIGYTVAPSISISEPVGLGSTQKATAIASITSGIVTSINVVYPGLGYTSTNPPQVLIEYPQISNYTENIPSVTYEGDFGTISGISTTSVGVASTGIVFDFVIPQNSFLRNSSIVGTSLTISGIQTGYYFVVLNSNVGNGVTSLNPDGSIVSIGNSFLDNVYRVASVSIAQTSAIGFGVTYVAKVTVSVQNYNGLSGIGYSSFFGEYSWGKINILLRPDPKEFNHYKNGLTGISTSPIVERVNPLKYLNYI